MQKIKLIFTSKMLLWHNILILLWQTTSVLTVNLAKIDPVILTNYWPYYSPNVFVTFGSTQPALEAAKRLRSSGTIAEKAGNVRRCLINLANMEQAGVINLLRGPNGQTPHFESMWTSNRLFINDPGKDLIKEISDVANVTFIKAEALHYASDERVRDNRGNIKFQSAKFDQNVTKGLKLIQAPEAWNILGGPNKAGEGVIVGVLDTGSYAGHEALIQNFVGIDYGFFDPVPEPPYNAGYMSTGTQVTGIIAGRNGIGVAPAAKHSQCRSCENLFCFEKAFEDCIQFFICPTLQNGTQRDCSRRVNVIHLSYWEDSPSIKPILDAAISAGILVVAPMGNKGFTTDLCNEGSYPGLFDEVIAVGIVNNTDHFDKRSSRGPNPSPKGNPKPDVVAPGVDIISAHYKDPDYKYITSTGSLTATAHVTGVVALLLTRDKTLTQDQARKLIIENTDRPHIKKSECNNGSKNLWPDPEFGYGRINALKALNAQTKLLMRPNKNESTHQNTCQQSFDSYQQQFHENFKNINSLNIEIREEIQRSVKDFERIAHEVFMFNATLKNLLNKAKQLEISLKALENN